MGFFKKLIIGLVILNLIVLAVFFAAKMNYDKRNSAKNQSIYTEVSKEDLINDNSQDTGDSNISTEIDITEKLPKITTGEKYSKKLVLKDNINILIIGEDKKNELYDTIGICSINKENEEASIIMIPRDTYISYNSEYIDLIEEKGLLNEPGVMKINYAHQIGGYADYEGRFDTTSISFLADLIDEMFDIHVDDYIKVNTYGFVELVDLFGGIDINVPYSMNYDDPYQDLSIHLNKGYQHLNGKQAEGFVRYRQGYNGNGEFVSYGDIERKNNQINFIKAFIKQHVTIKNIGKTKDIMDSLSRNVRYSFDFMDIFNLTGVAKEIASNNYRIESVALEGDQKIINRSSYIMLDVIRTN